MEIKDEKKIIELFYDKELPILIDIRDFNDYIKIHFKGSSSFTWNSIKERLYEFPPKGYKIYLIGSTKESLLTTFEYLKKNYTIVSIFLIENSKWNEIQDKFNQFIEIGNISRRIWKPSPFLEEVIEKLEFLLYQENNFCEKDKTALDLACGSGRDAVYLSMRNWKVTAIDYIPHILQKVENLALRYNISINTICIDLENNKSFLEKQKFDLVHVARYLYRPLFPILIDIIKPGGFIVYHTFMTGCEIFGKPKKKRFILESGELKKIFYMFKIIDFKETLCEDGRPIQCIFAQKPY